MNALDRKVRNKAGKSRSHVTFFEAGFLAAVDVDAGFVFVAALALDAGAATLAFGFVAAALDLGFDAGFLASPTILWEMSFKDYVAVSRVPDIPAWPHLSSQS